MDFPRKFKLIEDQKIFSKPPEIFENSQDILKITGDQGSFRILLIFYNIKGEVPKHAKKPKNKPAKKVP